METIYLLLGTNLGDRQANLRHAMSLLDMKIGRSEAISEVLVTEAVGFDGPPFLNCVARFSTQRTPSAILEICKGIEFSMGRRETIELRPDGTRIFHSRIIDIDILEFGDRVINLPTLTIPHPQIAARPFVKPLLDQVHL